MDAHGRYDAIVVGGGHNGLVAAAYLAKRGCPHASCWRPGTRRAAPPTRWRPWPEAPEFKVTTLSYVMSLMPDTILRDLRARAPRLPGHPGRARTSCRSPTGATSSQSDDDPKANYDEFAKFSKKDADAIEQWDAWIGGLADVLGPLLMTTPPRVGSTSVGDLQPSS